LYIIFTEKFWTLVALPFTLKSILRQKENCGNSNISPCKNVIFKENPLKEKKPNPSRYHNSTTNLNFDTSQNIVFQKSSYQNRPTTDGPKSLKLL
jgi:hypothetical protein